MSQSLPFDDFKWVDDETLIETFNVHNVSDDANTGYILEVDLEYPTNLHELHSDLPYCIEQKVPPNSHSKIPKLMATLYNKNKYVIHYRNVKQALVAGLILKKYIVSCNLNKKHG